MIETVLSIAGSDPTGGAGIQADLKTMAVIGVYGAAVITCITVQNSRGVTRVEPLRPVLVAEQIGAVLADHHVTHIKIGMVGNTPIAEAIAASLQHFPGEVIFDPVMAATTGQPLMTTGEQEQIVSTLIGSTTVLTPNLPELTMISGCNVQKEDDLRQAVTALFAQSGNLRCILVKGGHAGDSSMVTDSLFRQTDTGITCESAAHRFLLTGNTHGTGCTLSSAFAAFHTLEADYCAAFHRSVAFVHDVMEQSTDHRVIRNAEGKGGLLHHLGRIQS